MDITRNKKDFEAALKEMKSTIELLDYATDDALMDTLRLVVDEYEGCYVSNIEELIQRVVDLEADIAEYEEAQPSL